MKKYPRTSHIRGSRFQNGDYDLEAVPFNDLKDKNLVIEEKMDGANAGISFSDNGKLLLQSRGHYLRGGPREKHFSLLKQWASAREEELFCAIGSRYIMYGEWMYAKHTFFYDALPHYFMEFDIFDTESETFLSTPARATLLQGTNIVPVKVLHTGRVDSMENLSKMIVRSYFITNERVGNFLNAASAANVLPQQGQFGNKEIQEVLATGDWDTNMEGLYIKWEEGGIVKGRYKFVRQSFTSSILDQESHWHDRTIIPNKLLPGAYDKMFA